ncbi:SMP-30/gluconolactonase/LRE family protein [Sphingomonas sp. AOB5]|uniref:SMP-30/gluconolactonase/LRE family protein n=1 Tax=Sphingomonas sp. AOB5 TaxID=3034017 RepID=UPI0023F64292|nr:SMP-30/gluconolactonase/LRE family protein [Sphingomonas sp. AOB5]MDF7777643.1 SMP-30/gluconolactonase/LRE family protein [Sphingomonas sp. AOB5]
MRGRRPTSAALLAATLLIAGPALAQAPVKVLENAGFDGPESARHDPVRDEYLVTSTGPRGPESNGFVSRVSPDGNVIAAKWIEGGRNGVTLTDPFGIFIAGERIYVADVKAVHVFDRLSGAPFRSIPIPDAVRLNDLFVTANGTIYVTDSGSDDSPGALYRIDAAGKVSEFVKRDPVLERPNGIAVLADGTVVHGGRGVNLSFRSPAGRLLREVTLPFGRFDGIVPLADGSLLVSSQDGHGVYHLPANGKPVMVVKDIPVPAAIGFDIKRSRILIPQIRAATLTIVEYKP